MMGGKDDIKHKGKNYSNGSHEIKEEDDDDDDDIMKNLNKELRADGGEVNAYEEERKQMKLKRKQLKKKKKKKKRKEDLQKEKAPIDVPALLTKAGLALDLRDKIMEEGYDEIDWYMTANERDWARMMRDTGITERVKERIISCTKQ